MTAEATDPAVVARAVVVRDGQVLLVREVGVTWWFLPGGLVEPGEAPSDAVVRELAEEAGVTAEVRFLVDEVPNAYTDRDGREIREINQVLRVDVAGEPVSREPRLQYAWWAPDAVEIRPDRIRALLAEAVRRS